MTKLSKEDQRTFEIAFALLNPKQMLTILVWDIFSPAKVMRFIYASRAGKNSKAAFEEVQNKKPKLVQQS